MSLEAASTNQKCSFHTKCRGLTLGVVGVEKGNFVNHTTLGPKLGPQGPKWGLMGPKQYFHNFDPHPHTDVVLQKERDEGAF